MGRTIAIAAGVIATIATVVHAEEPPGGWFNERTVSGIHDVTVLLAWPLDYVPPCPPEVLVTRPGQTGALVAARYSPCRPRNEADARYDEEMRARDLRQMLGDPGRH
jgi:hypothetical protein